MTTLVGDTVGGYITYADAHRMTSAGVSRPGAVREVARNSVLGVLLTAVARALLFLVVLGVVTGGLAVSGGNAMAKAFGAIGCWPGC